MNEMVFVLAIIVVVSIVSVVKMVVRHRLGLPQRDGRGGRHGLGLMDAQESPDTGRLRDEVKMLKERIQTLERIAVDKENSLAREIDSLRDR